ncbi:hypothetical protein LK994_08585 [Ferruginibacter lapsinanis]|uniref:hypothetical protein n=1 Tax=Ferruginibacter lapsinanis TaxID=563172 RepID=UPI001E4DE635|nr:hypothetical protein [Ferruginibacter lapsinanis]UEG48691.1 hypothetical protein LK994_08585 [Ferruginibacter lapsinanis]
MSNELIDILSNSNKDIDNQQLMDYLSNQLSKSESHAIEKNMADDAFINDAVEGLQKLEGKKNLNLYVDQLNRDLQKHIAKSKRQKDKRRWKEQPYTYLAILLILFLLIICFIVIRNYLH